MLVDRRRPDRARIFGWASRLTRRGCRSSSFPKGTRSRDGRVARFKGGSFLPGARSRPAGRAAVGRRQPARDAEGRLATYPGDVRLVVHEPIDTRRAGRRPIRGHSANACAGIIAPAAESDLDVQSVPPEPRCRLSRSRLTSRRSSVRACCGSTAPSSSNASRDWMRRSPLPRPRCGCTPPAETTAVRTMYKRVGLDPTKTRPSSEALLRRVRKGDPLPRINSMVDVCNWCSLEFQLPYGLYDAARIEGDVELRLGARASRTPASARTMCTSAGGSRWPTRSAVRQSDVGFGADDGDDGDHAGVCWSSSRRMSSATLELGRVLDVTSARMTRVHRRERNRAMECLAAVSRRLRLESGKRSACARWHD